MNADVVRQNVSGDWQWGEFPETLLANDISEVLYRRITALSAVQRQVMEYACVFFMIFLLSYWLPSGSVMSWSCWVCTKT